MSNAGSYLWGECTRWAATLAPWIPADMGNAIDWLASAQRMGLPTSSTPSAGDVVVYGRRYGAFGHVAYVESVSQDGKTFTVSEMNYLGLNKVDTRTSSMDGVLGFISPPAGASSTSSASSPSSAGGIAGAIQEATAAFTGFLGRIAWLAVAIALIVLGLFLLVAEEIGRELRQHPEAVEAAALA